MKKKDKYKLFQYAKEQYSKDFKCNYEFKYLSKKALLKLLKEHNDSSMCEWDYCCYGLYQNCWQEPYFEGNWGMSQEKVNEIIKETIKKTAKICKRDNRILYCEVDDVINIVIIARDVMYCDFLIAFDNKKQLKR